MCALLHAALATTFFALDDRLLSFAVYSPSYTFPDNTEWRLTPAVPGEVSRLYLVLALAFVHLTSAFFHAGNVLVWRRWYLAQVSRCCLPSRWLEYAITASLMLAIFAYFSGITDLISLVLLATIAATVQAFGYLAEAYARPCATEDAWQLGLGARLAPHLAGYLPMGVAFLAVYFSIVRLDAIGSAIPWWVYAVLTGETVLYCSFAGVQLYTLVHRPSLYVNGELAYQILSLASKMLLGLLLLSQVLGGNLPEE